MARFQPKEFDYLTAKCNQSGMCRTSQWRCKIKVFHHCCWGISGAVLEDRLLDVMYLFYWTQVQLLFFFPSHVLWMDIWTHWHFPAYKTSQCGSVPRQVCFRNFNKNGHSSWSKHMRSRTLKMRITFTNVNNCASIFFPSPLNIFAHFFLLTKFCLPRLYLEL